MKLNPTKDEKSAREEELEEYIFTQKMFCELDNLTKRLTKLEESFIELEDLFKLKY